jgi:hypothetical protein
MAIWRDVWRIINGQKTSNGRDEDNRTVVRDSARFKGLSMSKQDRINAIIDNEQKKYAQKILGPLETVEDVKKRSGALVPMIVNNYTTSKPLTRTVLDAIVGPGVTVGGFPSAMGTMYNTATGNGMPGQDPATFNRTTPNLWLSPGEAAAIYSQKGIPETIIRKKSLSVLLNGVKIENPRLEASQIDLVQENLVAKGLPQTVAYGIRDSLTYGGALVFPMFRKDSPVTMHLPIEALLRYDVVGKDCIDRFVTLDRWNVVHIPNWNPVAEDFTEPMAYYIPFLGTDVHRDRCARIISAPQAGYWGTIMTMGWGISDIPGWLESVYNYQNVMSAIPTMINQMSILARTFNVDGIMATEGSLIADDIAFENTIKVREMSPNNPINLDVVGNIEAIQRDFKEVPNLVRLIRQDVGAKANIPEELVWSSERGAFASGDPTEGAQEKQWESIKYIHRDVAYQLRRLALLTVIDTLGKSRDVMRALPYTTISFDNPIVANAEVRAKIAGYLGKAAFDMRSAGFPADAVAQIMSSYGDDEFSVRSDLLEDLKKRQALLDEHEKEKHKKDMELLDAQIEAVKAQAQGIPGTGGGGTGIARSGGSEGYTRLEQHSKETTRGTAARKEGLARAQGKMEKTLKAT